MKTECYHRCRRQDLSPFLQKALVNNEIQLDGFVVCDSSVPLLKEDIDGQNITCVGPDHPSCPHPEEAKIV